MGAERIDLYIVTCERCGADVRVHHIFKAREQGWSCEFGGSPWSEGPTVKLYYCPKCTEFLKEHS